MNDDLQREYNSGRFDMAVALSTHSFASAHSAANYLRQVSVAKQRLNPGELLTLKQLRMELQKALISMDEAIAYGEPRRPRLVAAE